MPSMPIACGGKRLPLLQFPSAFLAVALAMAFSGTPPALAEVPPTDHAAHHPAQPMTQAAPMATQVLAYAPAYGAGQYAAPSDIPKTALAATLAPAAAGTSMSGASMSSTPGAGQMMAMMGEMSMPQPAFYPSLMAMPQVGPEQRLSLEMQSRQSISAGAALMTDGLVQLSRRTADPDAAAIRTALDQIKQGAALTEAGLSGQRVLTGEAPQQVALGWFRRQMNMPSLVEADDEWVIYGLTPFHLTVMVALILASITLVSVYVYRMGAAAQLVRRISAHMPNLPHLSHRAPAAAPEGSAAAPAEAGTATRTADPPHSTSEPSAGSSSNVDAPPAGRRERPPETKPAAPEAAKISFDPRETAVVVFSRSGKTVTLQPTESLFDAAEQAEVEIGGSCLVGTCSGCKIRVTEGNILTEGEDEVRFVRDTMVLACQSYPRGKVIVRA